MGDVAAQRLPSLVRSWTYVYPPASMVSVMVPVATLSVVCVPPAAEVASPGLAGDAGLVSSTACAGTGAGALAVAAAVDAGGGSGLRFEHAGPARPTVTRMSVV
jgi:hypothetical protein